MRILQRAILRQGESGQAMIMAAVLMTALMGTMGLAVEGGNAFVQYRQLQSAADMAAVVGAQDLPCATTVPEGAKCQTKAQQDGCTYAANNGYTGCFGCTYPANNGSDGCVAGSSWASVPPKSCSPYDFEDWGNGSTNPSCKSSTAPPFYDYIEVHLSKSLGNVPIFNIPVTLSAHAVAKHGVGIPADYALVSLSKTTHLSEGGHSTVQITGSGFSNAGVDGGVSACQGGWYSAGPVDPNVTTDSTGPPVFAPGGCDPNSPTDSTPAAESNLPPINDPYGGSSPPPTLPVNTSFPNCPECSQYGWYYDLSGGTGWNHGTSGPTVMPGGSAELFPGIYDSLNLSNGSNFYFNPGVYTFVNGYSDNHGGMCVYGAPVCGNLPGYCASYNSSDPSPTSDQWYYQCSPYGFWDSSSLPHRPAALNTVPNFTDGVTPLNGVTFYIPASSPSNINIQGNGGKGKGGGNNSIVDLAAPNPCAGTGSSTASSVNFPAGATSGVFNYSGANYQTGNAGTPFGVTSSTAGTVYPSMDFSLLGECSASQSLQVWPGEMAKPQHLHFFLYDPNAQGVKITGASNQHWTGISYIPNATWTMRGNGGSGGGIPWINGQLIVDSISMSGNTYISIEYRPCGPGSTACGSGAGTQLVE
ncbi:MAG: pilus assembly protein TadG-related protein [Chloroflexota bacterium]